MRNSVPHMKTSLCANVQLNRSNFDFNLKSSLTPFFHRALQLYRTKLRMTWIFPQNVMNFRFLTVETKLRVHVFMKTVSRNASIAKNEDTRIV